jgi:uncharacterized protein (DUF58 family)
MYRSLPFREYLRQSIQRIDRPAWRRFFLALLGLGAAFFLALYASALRESGRYEAGAAVAAISLLLAAIVAIKIVPSLARRTVLQRWMVKVRYEFTREGLVYLLVILVIVIAALNTGNNLLFMILASLLAGVLVSGLASQVVLSDLELDFALPEHIFAARPIVSRLTLRNGKWLFPSFSVMISGAGGEKLAAHGPPHQQRKLPRWLCRLAGQREKYEPAATTAGRAASSPPPASFPGRPRILYEPVYASYIPRHASVTERVELDFPRRGRYAQDGFDVSTQFPFSLLRKTRRIAARQEILVLPSVEPTEEFYEVLPLISGELESLYKGRGHDLYAIRDYQDHDSARHVDWKASAKALELKVREFTREDERRVTLVFDAELPSRDGKALARFEKAVSFCACLAWHFYEIDAQMQFITQGFETPMTGASEVVYPTLETLALVEPRLCGFDDSGGAAGTGLFSRLSFVERSFNIILTSRPRGSIPTSLWGSSYIVFVDSL